MIRLVAEAVQEPMLTDDDPCPTCGDTLTWCDCGQGWPREHLICLGCGEDVHDCDCEPNPHGSRPVLGLA